MNTERLLDEVESVVEAEREAQKSQYPSELHAVSRIEFGRVDAVELGYSEGGGFSGHDSIVDADESVTVGYVCSCGVVCDSVDEIEEHFFEGVESEVVRRLEGVGAVGSSESVEFDVATPDLWGVWSGNFVKVIDELCMLDSSRVERVDDSYKPSLFVRGE